MVKSPPWLQLTVIMLTALACTDDTVYPDSDAPTADLDGDGHEAPDDCNDNNAKVYPGAPEVCNDVDDNCDGLVDEQLDPNEGHLAYEDQDRDGHGDPNKVVRVCSYSEQYVPSSDDCLDTNPKVNPDQTEHSENECGDGVFDCNCDGVETKKDSVVGSCDRRATSEKACQDSAVLGYFITVPECGQAGSYVTGCPWTKGATGGDWGCNYAIEPRVQSCL